MKLVRYGKPGKEKPGLIDAAGKSATSARSSPTSTARRSRRASSRASPRSSRRACRRCAARRGSALASPTSAISSPSGSTTPTTPPNRAWRSPKSRCCSTRRAPASSAPMTTSSSPRARKRPTGRSSSASSSVRARELRSARRTRSPMSPAIASSTTSPSAIISSSAAAANGPKARAARPSARSARGWSPPTRSPIRRSSSMWLDVNGERMQSGSTATMIFGVAHARFRYLSQFMILEPGDVITTGTPPGVGDGKKPPRYLKAGDTVSLGIDGPRPAGAARRRLVEVGLRTRGAPLRAARSYLGAGAGGALCRSPSSSPIGSTRKRRAHSSPTSGCRLPPFPIF